jgi:hypothetical protein
VDLYAGDEERVGSDFLKPDSLNRLWRDELKNIFTLPPYYLHDAGGPHIEMQDVPQAHVHAAGNLGR